MTSVFSDYVQSLGPTGEPPDRAIFENLMAKLRGALVHELKKRSLWSSPPSYLGVYGGSWMDDDVLEELLLDCYMFIFIRRLRGLKKQVESRPNIDGLIFLNIRNFLYETQKRHDPLGFRVFEVVQSAVLRMVEDGALHVLAGDSRIRNDTILGFSTWGDTQAARGADLRSQAEVWNSQLLPDLVTAWSKDEVRDRLKDLIAELPGVGVEVFQFHDLVEPMKKDVRARWQLVRLGSEGDSAAGEGGEDLVSIADWVRPDRGYEERQSFLKLLECVGAGLEHLPERPKTKEYLHKLWVFLQSWTAEPEPAEPADRGETDQDFGERFPADLQVSRLLEIPRGRIPGLKEALGRLVAGCQSRLLGRAGSGGEYNPGESLAQSSFASSHGDAVMNLKSRREQLRLQTGEAAALVARDVARVAEFADQSPSPGETFAFHEASALPVEWVFLEQDPSDARRVLIAPVDDHPAAGSHDVAAGGARTIRCGLVTRIDGSAMAPEGRAGRLEPETLARARSKRSSISGGTLNPTVAEREVDSSPEYQAWMRMLSEATTALPGNPRAAADFESGVLPFLRSGEEGTAALGAKSARRSTLALAAALAAAIIGLSFWLGRLGTGGPTPFLLPTSSSGEIAFQDPERTIESMTLAVDASHLLIYLLVSRVDDGYTALRVDLLEKHDDEALWASPWAEKSSELLLVLPRALVTEATYRIRLSGRNDAGVDQVIEVQELEITLPQ